MGQQLDCCKSGSTGNPTTNGLFVADGNSQSRLIRSKDEFKRSNNNIEEEEDEDQSDDEGGEDEQEEQEGETSD